MRHSYSDQRPLLRSMQIGRSASMEKEKPIFQPQPYQAMA